MRCEVECVGGPLDGLVFVTDPYRVMVRDVSNPPPSGTIPYERYWVSADGTRAKARPVVERES